MVFRSKCCAFAFFLKYSTFKTRKSSDSESLPFRNWTNESNNLLFILGCLFHLFHSNWVHMFETQELEVYCFNGIQKKKCQRKFQPTPMKLEAATNSIMFVNNLSRFLFKFSVSIVFVCWNFHYDHMFGTYTVHNSMLQIDKCRNSIIIRI